MKGLVIVPAVAAVLGAGCSRPARCTGPELTQEGALAAAIDRLQSEEGGVYMIGETPQVADEPIDPATCCTVTREPYFVSGADSWHVTTTAKTRAGRVIAFTDMDMCGKQIDTGEIIELSTPSKAD